MSSTKFVFFGQIGKTRCPLQPLIGWDIFDFSSETAERNSVKLDRKQDHNILYQVCVFRTDRKKTRWPLRPLIGWDIFDFSSETDEQNSTKLDRKQDLNVLYQVCVFRTDWKNNMAALASDWLRHFRLLLWNRWTEFKETWQEARSQRPLPSLCFWCRLEKQGDRPGQSVKKVAHCTQVHDMWPFWPLVVSVVSGITHHAYFEALSMSCDVLVSLSMFLFQWFRITRHALFGAFIHVMWCFGFTFYVFVSVVPDHSPCLVWSLYTCHVTFLVSHSMIFVSVVPDHSSCLIWSLYPPHVAVLASLFVDHLGNIPI